jgi:hypothetical protein
VEMLVAVQDVRDTLVLVEKQYLNSDCIADKDKLMEEDTMAENSDYSFEVAVLEDDKQMRVVDTLDELLVVVMGYVLVEWVFDSNREKNRKSIK